MSEQEPTQVNFIDDLVVRGLNVLITDKREPLFLKTLLSSHPEVIFPRMDLLDVNIQNKIIEGALSENPSLFTTNDNWWNYVIRALSRIEAMPLEEIFSHSGLYVLLNRVRDLREEVSWFNVLLKLSEATVKSGAKCVGFSTVLDWLIQADVENLRKLLYRTETKSYPSALKEDLYKKAVDLGLLDVKIARRIRSDSSGSLSSDILAYLFEHRSIYSDDVFQDLVTQFSDTKHKWVARYIAMNMPMHLVPFLMGIKDDVALKILEKRMELAEE